MKKSIVLLLLPVFLISCNTSKTVLKSVGAEVLFSGRIESGSVVKLEAKTYNLAEHILISGKENITIDGNGATLVMQSLADDVILIENSKQIILKNFKATHIEPQGPVGCTGNVIHVEDGSNILIENCELNGSGIVGVAAYRTENLRIIANLIHKNSEYGIIYQGPSVEIKRNVFQNNGKGNLYFSYRDSSWPPKELINSDRNAPGLEMKGNVFE